VGIIAGYERIKKMKEKIFIFDILEKDTGKKCFSLQTIGKTEQGARAKLSKAYGKKLLHFAKMQGKDIAWSMPFHYYKAVLKSVIDF